jgi:Zn-dependent M28 family amino/carboxypeptidase
MTRGRRLPILTKRGAVRLAILFTILAGLSVWGYGCMIGMPGKSYDGPLPPLTAEEAALSASLKRDVTELASTIGIRNWLTHARLETAADYLEKRLKESGFAVSRQTYTVDGNPFHNLEVEIRGATAPDEIVVVGGHYDSVVSCPGANDNATGAAATVALAAAFAKEKPARTLRFVAFTNEEPPHYRTDEMGSVVYAKRCRERKENVVAMVSLETMGCYSDREKSQSYPAPLSLFYPSKGNFIAFVSNVSSRRLVKQAIRVFRDQVKFPSEGAALPGMLPGIGWSDHWSFWEQGYPAFMVTDTAPFRYAHYHTPQDTVDKVDFDSLARVTEGLVPVVRAFSSPAP